MTLTKCQLDKLHILADPASHVTSLGASDRRAVQAVLDEVEQLNAENARLRATLAGIHMHTKERLDQHRANLRLWESGYLSPTEPDPEERRKVMAELGASIEELKPIEAEARKALAIDSADARKALEREEKES